MSFRPERICGRKLGSTPLISASELSWSRRPQTLQRSRSDAASIVGPRCRGAASMTIRVGSCGSLESRLRSVRRVSHGQGRLHPIAIDRRTRYQEDETSFGPAMMLSPGQQTCSCVYALVRLCHGGPRPSGPCTLQASRARSSSDPTDRKWSLSLDPPPWKTNGQLIYHLGKMEDGVKPGRQRGSILPLP